MCFLSIVVATKLDINRKTSFMCQISHKVWIKGSAENIHTLVGDNTENKCKPRSHFYWSNKHIHKKQ